MPIAVVRQTRLYRQIADQLQRLIRNGEFPPGSKLPAERELSQMLGVSRASVREALIALEVVGDVEVRVGHGVVVLDHADGNAEPVMRAIARNETWQIDPEFASEVDLDLNEEIPPFALLQARRHVEPEAARLAARNATEQQRRAIRAALTRNIIDNSAIDPGSQTIAGNSLVGDRLLHIRIAEASQNPAYAFLIKHLLGRQYGVMFRRLQAYYMGNQMWTQSQADHERIVAAIEAGDETGAEAAMAAHLDYVIDVFFTE